MVGFLLLFGEKNQVGLLEDCFLTIMSTEWSLRLVQVDKFTKSVETHISLHLPINECPDWVIRGGNCDSRIPSTEYPKWMCGGTIFNDALCIFKMELQTAYSRALFED